MWTEVFVGKFKSFGDSLMKDTYCRFLHLQKKRAVLVYHFVLTASLTFLLENFSAVMVSTDTVLLKSDLSGMVIPVRF